MRPITRNYRLTSLTVKKSLPPGVSFDELTIDDGPLRPWIVFTPQVVNGSESTPVRAASLNREDFSAAVDATDGRWSRRTAQSFESVWIEIAAKRRRFRRRFHDSIV